MGRKMFFKFSENGREWEDIFSENGNKHVAISWEDHPGEVIFRLPESISRNSDGVRCPV